MNVINSKRQTSTGTSWMCIEPAKGWFTAIRLGSDGNVECISTDSSNCFWHQDPNRCISSVIDTKPETIKPLACGEHSKKVYGATGYDDPKHWCAIGRVYYAMKEWLCLDTLNGWYTPVRMNAAGDVECLSSNVRDCAWLRDPVQCGVAAAMLGAENIKPLSCGKVHQATYGSDGYSDPKHWCAIGKKQLALRNWACVKQVDHVKDVFTNVRLNARNDVECMSTDATNCIWLGSPEDCPKVAETTHSSLIRPLACGEHSKRLYGLTGYEDLQGKKNPTHWCSVGRRELMGDQDLDNDKVPDDVGTVYSLICKGGSHVLKIRTTMATRRPTIWTRMKITTRMWMV